MNPDPPDPQSPIEPVPPELREMEVEDGGLQLEEFIDEIKAQAGVA